MKTTLVIFLYNFFSSYNSKNGKNNQIYNLLEKHLNNSNLSIINILKNT